MHYEKYIFSCFFFSCYLLSCAQPVEKNKTVNPQHNMDNKQIPTGIITDTAYFGEGCFWCTEAFFQRLKGVYEVNSGYGGGHVANPTYEQVCDKNTGHVELAQIIYDPNEVSFDELLEVFWKTHDPTTLNQQGADVGPQYRSVIFYTNEMQREKAEQYKAALDKSGAFNKPIVTAIDPFKNFYRAEQYHQNYYNNNGDAAYCRFVIRPKLEKFEKVFKNKLKKGVE
ncbi:MULTISPECIES: peptide-methionine (S)-S-oxide reductase MsrA [Hydrotalea]|uniref:peptide-methionine (S)-S-oxide reductase MsrA n=1 Tax=Hydrotalea TaxID=1004300 RepID=UPI000A49FF22|nr:MULTISPECIES: peptide-methionine (S)-S-oxide reductase MsrA [Hydrotalea]